MEDLSMSNSMIKAMFESSAPKYKFGGSGSSLNDIASAAERDNKQAKKQKKAPPKNVDQRR